MFSLFPEILFLEPAGIALLRLTAGIFLIYIGYSVWLDRRAIAGERFPIIGHMPEWLSAIAAAAQVAIGTLLVVGAWTQLMAILGAIVALKCFFLGKKYGGIVPIARSASILLFVILLALVVMGAGAFAFDLPL